MDSNTATLDNYHVLYRNAKHGISKWEIWSEGNTIIFSSESKLGDSPTRATEVIAEGKAGRTIDQQIKLRVDSRVNNKRDHGYVDTIDKAKEPLTNQMGLFQPMLAVKLKDIRNFNPKEYYAQFKLDGHRCLITNTGEGIVAYSRRGKPITTINHIIKDLVIEPGTTIDGELYVHGQSLQTISSWAKRMQPNSAKLQFVCYDIVASNMPWDDRMSMLDDLERDNQHIPNFIVLPSVELRDRDALWGRFHLAKDLGYEGLILRQREYSYEVGRRSKGLVKVKQFEDGEFVCVDIIPSKDGWGVAVCLAPNGLEFKTPCPGNLAQKREALRNKENYIGRSLTCEFANYTADGKPFHAVATGWRKDL